MGTWNYKKLLSEKQFLKVAARARTLIRNGSDLVAIYYKEKTLIFKTRSGTDSRLIWTQTIEISDATMENIMNNVSFKSVEDLIKYSDLKIHCNCLAEGTRVLTLNGFKPIQEVTDRDMVMGSDAKWHKVCGVLKSEYKTNWVKLNIRGMREPLIVSKDHKVLFSTYRDKCACGCDRDLRSSSVKNRLVHAFRLWNKRKTLPKHSYRQVNDGFERYQLHKVEDYKAGELLCSPIIKGNYEFDCDYARMLGYYLAEGRIPLHGNTVVLTLNQNEECTIARDIIDYFSSIGIKTKVNKRSHLENKWLTVNIYSKKFRNDCEYFCGKGSINKKPNPEILSWTDSAKESFLIGHLLGDGAVDDSFRWLSTSKDLVDMLQLIINSLGCHASTYVANYNSQKPKSNICYAVSVSINEYYSHYIKYKSLFRQKDLVNLNKSRGQNDVYQYVLYKIISVEETESQYGYDIILADEPHMFVADNVIVSNCPAFTYWGYKYMAWKRGYGLEKELRRPRVRNPFEQGFACFPAGQMVLTSKGEIPIENICVGDLVVTSDGTLKPVVDVGQRDYDGLISTRVGHRWIESTPDHKFLSLFRRSNNSAKSQNWNLLDYNEIQSLSVGDFLTTTLVKLNHTKVVDVNLAWLLGLYLGDGSTCWHIRNKSNSYRIGDSNITSITIAICWNKVHEYEREFKERGIPYYSITKTENNGGVIKIIDPLYIKFCLDNGGANISRLNLNKFLTEDVINWNLESQKAVLEGFFSADGTLVHGSGNGYTYLTWFNTNKQIMSLLCLLMRQFAPVSLNSYKRKPFTGKGGKLIIPKEMYWFRLTGEFAYYWHSSTMLRFKNQYSDDIKWSHSSPYSQDLKYLLQIKEQKIITGVHRVYSLSVLGNPSFIVNGAIVHNCKHLYFVLQLYPFWSKALASKFRNYYNQKKNYEDSISGLQRVRMNKQNRDYVDKLPSENNQNVENNEDELTEEDLLE